MVKKYIVAIDDYDKFLERLGTRLDDLGILNDYEYYPIKAVGQTTEEIVNHCTDEIKKVNKKGLIEIVLVDIVLIESEDPPQDRSGFTVAKTIRSILPKQVPIVGLTRYIRDQRLISEISLDPNIDCTILKGFLEEVTFNLTRGDFLKVISKAKVKAGVIMEKVYLRNGETIDSVEGRFKLSDDPRCNYQALQIGENNLMVLLERLFPFGQGTITYLRPGFSGSFLFKVSVKTVNKEISPSISRIWVIKISDDEGKLESELKRYTVLKSRISQDIYPQLLKEELTTINKWAVLAFEMKEDAVTFSEYVQQKYSAQEIIRLIDTSLIPFLQAHYGDTRKKRAYLWKEFFSLDEKTCSGVLNFIDEAKLYGIRRLNRLCRKMLQRLESFVRSNGASENDINSLDAECDTRYVHGDLHSRNIIVAKDAQKLIFIDFANSDQSHYMKDIAKLETDLIFVNMDSRNWNDTNWERLTAWKQIFGLLSKKGMFDEKGLKNVKDVEIKKIVKIIQALRRHLKSFENHPNEQQYLIALLHYALKFLSYPEVSVQKKVFAVHYIEQIFDEISGRRQ